MDTTPIDDKYTIEGWAIHQLHTLGYHVSYATPETVLDTPWSSVLRFSTTAGYIYLKQTPELLALEVPIIKTLREQFNISVPLIIAHNPNLHCFLMQDAGTTLREQLKKELNIPLFCRAIRHFTAMQVKTAGHIDVFLKLGVPDWRLATLPSLYAELLTKKEVLLRDGLTETKILALQKLTPQVATLCKKLSAYGIKESIVQPDFNDNNTLISEKTNKITIIDLGEIAITHPFFSLLNGLYQAKKHHQLTQEDPLYQNLLDACLDNFTESASRDELKEALLMAEQLHGIYAALANYRLKIACDSGFFSGSFQRDGRVDQSLMHWLNVNC